MRKLSLPLTDDGAVLQELKKSRGKHAKTIKTKADQIAARYQTYEAARGDPWLLPEDLSFRHIRFALNQLYKSPPKALTHLANLRSELVGACPMCGRDGLGTLDHYLPKSLYSEFSFFSRNLVPACDRCNNARNNLARGDNHGERPLHPYFDAFVANRVMSVNVQPDWRAPKLTPVPFGVAGPELMAVQWHIDNIVRPAGIDAYLRNMWGILVNSQDLLGTIPTPGAVAISLQKQMRIEAQVAHTENAWRSCFYHGISSNNGALQYLASLV